MLAVEQVATRFGLLDRLAEARSRTDELFAIVRREALYERPIPERHRIIFYIGHLEAFDWNLLRLHLRNLESFDPALDHLFAFGIDPVGGGLPADQPSDWPAFSTVQGYCDQLRERLDAGLADAEILEEPSGKQLLHVAIEHRLMHAETLAYMLHQLPYDQKVLQPRVREQQASPVTPGMVMVPAGSATLGMERFPECFGWDNEFEAHSVQVPAFSIDRYKVTHGEYLKFVDAGGYENEALWSREAWKWKLDHGISHPIFWKRVDNAWFWRGMFEEFPLPASLPVYVSHAEASAYARWVGKALPTEAQWHRAAYGTPSGDERAYPWGNAAPTSVLGNFDFAHWDPVPVTSVPNSASAFGVTDMLGNGWEWTSTVFAPFAGFEPFPFYPGYSANFFDGRHFVLKGGSPRTAACMLRPSFRNWFQPHYQYVYAGLRCVSPS